MFSQGLLNSFFNGPSCHQSEPVTHLNRFSVPATTLDDGQVPRPLMHGS